MQKEVLLSEKDERPAFSTGFARDGGGRKRYFFMAVCAAVRCLTAAFKKLPVAHGDGEGHWRK